MAIIRKKGNSVDIYRQEREIIDSAAKKLERSIDCGEDADSKERELMEIVNRNSKLIDKIFLGVHRQVNEKNEFMRKKVCSELPSMEVDEFQPIITAAYHQYERITLTNYIKYQIQILQKKQAAQTLSKIVAKRVDNGEIVYKVFMEEPFGTVELSESELAELNALRDTSLLQCYNVGWKSKYNFVCHNVYSRILQYLGFQALVSRKEQLLPLLKTQNMLPFLSQSNKFECSPSAKDEFSSLQSCHQCRLLYNKNILMKCSYKVPKDLHEKFPVYFDPYIYFLTKNEPKSNEASTKTLQSFIESNPYQYYVLKDGEYSCGRYLCKMCSKKHLGSNCKMCQQMCICGRCMRNSMISRLISIFVILGGNIFELKQKSYFSKMLNRSKQQGTIEVDRTRYAKEKTLVSYKLQFEELRLMAHMVMRRESLKQQQFLCEQRIFKQKLQTH